MIIEKFTAVVDFSAYRDINSMAFRRLLDMCNYGLCEPGSQERKDAYKQMEKWKCFPANDCTGYVERINHPEKLEDPDFKTLTVYLVPNNYPLSFAGDWTTITLKDEDGWKDKLDEILIDNEKILAYSLW